MLRCVFAVALVGCSFDAKLGGSVEIDAAPDDAVDAPPIDVPNPNPTMIVVDGHSNGAVEYALNLVFPHTVPATNDRLLLVGISISFAGTLVTAVTYGTTPLTRVGARDAIDMDGRIELWSLVAPPPGTANIAIVVDDATSAVVAGAGSFSNVNQTTPLGAFMTAVGTTGKPTISIPAQPTELVHDLVMWNGGRYSNLTVDNGQTAPWKRIADDIVGGGSMKPGAGGPTQLSWSVNGNFNDYWAIGAVAIKPR